MELTKPNLVKAKKIEIPQDKHLWMIPLAAGRKNKIETPQELENLFLNYCKWIDENPFIDIDYVGKDATAVERIKRRPLQKAGFAFFSGLSSWKIIDGYKVKSEDFSRTVTRIECCIENQQLEGAMVGQLEKGIVGRLNGLVDKTDVTSNGETIKTPVIIDWSGKSEDKQLK